MNEFFRKASHRTAEAVGSYWAFVIAFLVVLGWLATGPLFNFSDTWQLVINTATTIVTFLMVFLIQNAQNRDSKAIQLKLDELIRALKGARNELVDLEDLSDKELAALQQEFKRLQAEEKSGKISPPEAAREEQEIIEKEQEAAGQFSEKKK
jgi:low affinity Fe/Cu permease